MSNPPDPTEDAQPASAPGAGGVSGRDSLLLAFLVALAAGAVLCGYEMLRSSANTLFVQAYGKQGLPWALGLTLIGVTLLTYIYGWLLTTLGPRHTLQATTVLAIVTMLASYAAIRVGVKPARAVLFIFKESYVVLLVEQIWSYIDSTLDPAAAKRLNGPICGIAGFGAVAGGLLLGKLSQPLGTLNMLLLAAGATLLTLPFLQLLFARFGAPSEGKKKHGGHLALYLFRRERILPLLIALIASTQVASTILEIAFKSALQDYLPDPDRQNAFSGNYYALINGAAMFFQFIGAPLLLSLFSGRVIHILVPLLNLGALGYMLVAPPLWGTAIAYGTFKTLDYSLFRAAKELLYVPLPFDARYRAKEVIDVLGNRVSKGLTSLGVTVAQWGSIVFSTHAYTGIGICAVAVWLSLAIPLTSAAQEERSS
jgi:AAA family ATP:ADP antiporter